MNRDEQLKKVQMLSFVVYDTALFLDTHPENQAALNYYGKYRNLCKQAMDEYQASYGPLTISNVNSEEGWSWIDSPWPWEMED